MITEKKDIYKKAFSILEFSILLMVMAVIIGGALVGSDLIHASHVSATIAQIESYQSAIGRFYTKYNALPGDLNNQTAKQFGFTPRGAGLGEGDGNRVIEGISKNGFSGSDETTGETAMFWVDLTSANGMNINYIDGHFATASPTHYPDFNPTGDISEQTFPSISAYLPAAKLGESNYIYVWSNRQYMQEYYRSAYPDGKELPGGLPAPANYFGLSQIGGIGGVGTRTLPGMTSADAAAIDKKVDDGYPTTGNVTAQYISMRNFSWLGPYSGPYAIGDKVVVPATPATFSSCYDNKNAAGGQQKYSTDQNGNGFDCALSFRIPDSFQ